MIILIEKFDCHTKSHKSRPHLIQSVTLSFSIKTHLLSLPLPLSSLFPFANPVQLVPDRTVTVDRPVPYLGLILITSENGPYRPVPCGSMNRIVRDRGPDRTPGPPGPDRNRARVSNRRQRLKISFRKSHNLKIFLKYFSYFF
jgi:hypothetical protein